MTATADQLFAAVDPDTVLSDALAIYEAETGVALAPSDPRRLHLQAMLLLLTQHRGLIDYAGRQSLPRDVSEEWIDDLAELLGVERLQATSATTTVRLTMSTPGPHLIAAGKRLSGGDYLWTLPQIAVGIGETTATATATCTTTGAAPNDVAPGTWDASDSIPYLDSVENLTRTSGGTDEESTEALRARLRTAPDGWSSAGPREAYEAQARAVSTSILDVRAVAKRDSDAGDMAGAAVDPGVVRVLVLALGGATSTLLDAVDAALSADEVRPLTDDVEVTTPETVDLTISGTYYIGADRAGEATEIQAAVDAAFAEYLDWQTSKIGRDINPDRLRSLALAAGAKRLDLGAFSFAALDLDEVAAIPATVQDLSAHATCVGDGTVEIEEHAGSHPAPGDYWAICSSAAAGATPAVFQVFRVDPASPALVAEVDADGVLATVLGLDVTITEGGTPFSVFDLWTFTVAATPSLTYGGIEDE